MTGASSQRTRLSASIDNSTNTFDVDDVSGIATGTRIAVGLEEMHVWTVTGNTLVVQRGDFGSTKAAHANASIVTVNPEFSDAKIFRSLQSTVEQLRQESLYRVAHLDFAAPHDGEFLLGPAPDASDEASRYDGVLEVLIGTTDETEPWARVPWDVMQTGDADGSDALVTIPDARYYSQPVRVVRRLSLGQITGDGTGVETETGVLNTDLIAVGAALRLGAGRALRRTSLHNQGDSRRANEVAAFSTGNATRGLEDRYKKLLQAEQIRLRKQYPYRKHQ